MNRKPYLLVFALLFPVCIFLFLKFFGRNEFNVPPLFLTATDLPEGCPPVEFPYALNDATTDTLGLNSQVELLVLFFTSSARKDSLASSRQWDRVRELFPEQNVRYRVMQDQIEFRRCVLLMENPNSIAVVDKKGLVRGHYNAASLEDVDRLVTELKIILNKY